MKRLSDREVFRLEDTFGANHYERLPFVARYAKDVFLFDDRGVAYLDLLAAYSAVNQGHHHPEIVQALINALNERKVGVISNVVYSDSLALLVSKIARLVPCLGHQRNKVLLKNGGVESVETAIKLMRGWGHQVLNILDGQQEIIVFRNNFHGRTSTVVSASSTEKYKKGFCANSDKNGFVFADFGDIKSVECAVTKNTCGILVEPRQGEGGMNIPPNGFLRDLRELADTERFLLIFDEIQVGLGRTGKMFAFEHENIIPDGLILGKALSGGLIPVSAFIADSELMDKVFYPGRDGSTYGGYQGACAVSLAALHVITNEGLVENAKNMGNLLIRQLKDIAKNSKKIKEIRGEGLFIGVELKDGNAWDVCKELLNHHIVTNDSYGHTIRISPPLTITKEHVDLIVSRLAQVLI